jgi:hypothetical protein
MRKLLYAFAVLAAARTLSGQGTELPTNTRQLSGIRSVFVQLPTDLTNIDTTTIRNIVESEVRRLGVTVQSRPIPRVDAIIGVNVHLNPAQTAMTCFIQVNQDAHLDRNPQMPAVARWFSRLVIAQVNPSDLNRQAKDCFRDLATDLSNDYLAANSPPKGRP